MQSTLGEVGSLDQAVGNIGINAKYLKGMSSGLQGRGQEGP